jgi:hypothetical protein
MQRCERRLKPNDLTQRLTHMAGTLNPMSDTLNPITWHLGEIAQIIGEIALTMRAERQWFRRPVQILLQLTPYFIQLTH